jgi:serine/threonine protein kinase
MKFQHVAQAICTAKAIGFQRYVGAGAFKETYEVSIAGVPYALKVHNAANSPERSTREVQAMVRCAHANIATLNAIDVHVLNSVQYVYSIEEFLPGGTLSERLAAGLMSQAEVQSIGTALIDAVAHIAALDLVHRDLKPDNIMFRADGQVVVVDFGLVRDLGAQSLTHTHLIQGPGTPLFAPAEQLNNEKSLIDWRSDQFSLGVVLAYCAFGHHPFQAPGDGNLEIVTRVSARAGIPDGFGLAARSAGLPVLERMVSPWPVQRFRTPSLLASAWRDQAPVRADQAGAN